mmetsp:Transcript_20532/g.56388  ORF Transcript_20532/g.56388 Transcript_20532/m.56388 type:complete len:104 (+) Transcript_20532:168-479(+)
MLELTTLLVNAHFEAEGRRGSERFSSPSAERGRVATEAMEAIAITLTRHARTDHLGVAGGTSSQRQKTTIWHKDRFHISTRTPRPDDGRRAGLSGQANAAPAG